MERQLLIAGLRVIAVAVVVDHLKRLALVGLRRVVPPVAARDERTDAGVLKALCHADVCLGLDLVEELRELLLLADVLGGVLGIALPLRPLVVLLDVHVGRAPPDRRYRVLVHQRDEENCGVVLPLDAGVGVYVVEDLHRAAEPLVLGGLVDRHDCLDRIRVKRLVEALAAAKAAHRVEVERRVDACFLALCEQVVELVEARGRYLGIGLAVPEVVPLVLRYRHVDVVEAHRVPAAADEILDDPLALLLREEVRVEAEIAADEADGLVGALVENEMAVLRHLGETVLAGRGVGGNHVGEVEDRALLDVVLEREDAPVGVRHHLRGRRREVELHLAGGLLQRVGKRAVEVKFYRRARRLLGVREVDTQLEAPLLVLAAIPQDGIALRDGEAERLGAFL